MSNEKLHTHDHENINDLDIGAIKTRLLENKEHLALPLEEELKILDELQNFAFGRFLLKNGGLSGRWTSYLILHAPKQNLENPLENWLINQAPMAKATRERFWIFQKEFKEHVKNNITFASVPCGLMDDLLLIDDTGLNNFIRVGIDLDEESLNLAQKHAKEMGKESFCKFYKQDAFSMSIKDEFDLVTSNGLNVYEPDDNKVIDLYRNIWHSLKKDGIFINSFITSPPQIDSNSPWKNYKQDDLIKQKALFNDILKAKWQSFRTHDEHRFLLERAGFNQLKVIEDSQGMYPTVVAQKMDL